MRRTKRPIDWLMSKVQKNSVSNVPVTQLSMRSAMTAANIGSVAGKTSIPVDEDGNRFFRADVSAVDGDHVVGP